MVEIDRVMSDMAGRRPVFCSEADFQHELAMELRMRQPDQQIRLEYPLGGDLRGAIDVNLPTKTSGEPRVRTVQPGQAVAFDDVRGIVALAPAQRTEIVQTTWPDALLDFDNVTVRDFVAEANRYAEKRLVVSDPALAARRISGTFRVGDPGRLAGHISVLLDAEVRQSPNGDFILVGRSR